jgi:hypothetical protein
MTEQDALKVNDLYKQLDVLAAENAVLKSNNGESQEKVLASLEEIKGLLREKALK